MSDIAIAVTKLDEGRLEIKAANKEIKDILSVMPRFGPSTISQQQPSSPDESSNGDQPNLPATDLSFNNVPPFQVFNFIGQEDKLVAMQLACQHRCVFGTMVALIGMAGSGKTQLAMRFCRSQSENHKSIFWADASTLASLKRSYVNMANSVSQSSPTFTLATDSEKSIAYLKRFLSGAPQPWILVLDNYDDPEEFQDIRSFIPYNDQGVVIITSRHHDTARLGTCIEIKGMNENDGLTLLHKRSGYDRTNKTESVAKAIVRRLGYLPLAIDQAGSYVRHQRVTLYNFLDHYEQTKLSVLSHTPKIWEYCKQISEEDKEAKLSVFTTWEMVFNRLKATRPKLASLMSLLGYFYHLSIDEALFQTFRAHCGSGLVEPAQGPNVEARQLGQVYTVDIIQFFLDKTGAWDTAAFRNALADLKENYLIENFEAMDNRTTKFSLHPLISDWIKIRSDENSKRRLFEQVCRITACFLHADNFKERSQETKIEIQGHLDEFMANEKTYQCESFKLGLGRLRPSGLAFAKFYFEHGRYASATKLYQRVVDDYAAVSEDEDPKCLEAMESLGQSLHCLGQHQRAEKICLHALKGFEKQFGPDDLRTLSAVEKLANIHRSHACYHEAETLYVKVLTGRQQKLGDDHDKTLSAVANLADIHRSQGKYGEAAILYKKLATFLPSDKIQQRHNLVWIINQYANFLQSQAQLQQAEQLYKEVLTIRERTLGKDHPDTLWTLADLANNYRTQERYEEAELAYKRAQTGLQQQLGRDHPETLWVADGLGNVYCSQRRLEEAESILVQVLADRERQLGPNHHNTLRTVHGLGDVYFFQNRLEESRCLYERAVRGLESKLGHEHPKTLAAVEKLALNRRFQGGLQEAEALLTRVLHGRMSCLGDIHSDTLKTIQNLVSVRTEMNIS